MMMMMDRLLCVGAILLCLLQGGRFQAVFQPEDLEWKSFSGCCGDNGCQSPGSPNYYRYLAVSEDGTNVWVGAMNYLFKLTMNNLTCDMAKYLPVEPKKTTRCTVQGKNLKPDCQNHIRTVIELNSDDLFVCGTGAYSPVNYTFNRREVTMREQKAGVALCPYDPLDNNTAIKIDSGNPWNASALYFGTYTDFIKNFPVFFRPEYIINGKHYLRKTSDSEDNAWLHAPQFVGSFDEDDSVFFFFREIGIESPADDRRIYSRIGKVCKKDQGGGQLEITRTKWLSFQKARLNCSLPGNQPYYFDDIYDVYKSGNYFYALYYKQAGLLSSSAICVFRKEDILQVFRGKFQYKNKNENWETLVTDPSPRLDNCSLYERDMIGAEDIRSRHQLMADTVKPVYGQPIFYQQGVQMMKIAVTEKQNNARNIYVATDQGKVYDIFFKEGTSESLSETVIKLNKIYEPFHESEKSYAVWNMKLLGDFVLLGTDYNVTRLSLNVCDSILHIDNCILDTKCVWDKCTKKCKTSIVDDTSDCIISHIDVTHDKTMLDLLIAKDAVPRVQETDRKGIVGIYTTLEILYPVTRRQSTWKRAVQNEPEVEIDLEKDVTKYALSYKGDLMISNTSFNDAGHYKAYDQDDVMIADYRLDVIENVEDLIDAWKQQFSDWSMAFVKWKHCSNDYFQGCVKTP